MKRMRVAVVSALVWLAGTGFALEFPGANPGIPTAVEKDGCLTLSNDVIPVSWGNNDGHLAPEAIQNKLSSQSHSKLGRNLFRNKMIYFKWDKAGSLVSPHFMALLRCAEEMRKVDPEVFCKSA